MQVINWTKITASNELPEYDENVIWNFSDGTRYFGCISRTDKNKWWLGEGRGGVYATHWGRIEEFEDSRTDQFEIVFATIIAAALAMLITYVCIKS